MPETGTNEKLVKIESLLESNLKKQEELIQKLAHTVYGNGRPGITTDLAVLKDSEQRRRKRDFFIWCAIVSAWIKMLFDHFTKGG